MYKVAIVGILPHKGKFGGLETYLHDFLLEMKDYPEVDLTFFDLNGEPSINDRYPDNVSVIPLVSPLNISAFLNLVIFFPFEFFLKSRVYDFDLVSINTTPLYFFLHFLVPSKTRVLTVHGILQKEKLHATGLTRLKREFYSLLERLAVYLSDNMVVDTPYVANYLKEKLITSADIRVLPIGINLKRWKRPAANTEVEGRILFVGGVEKRKNLENLIKAIKLSKENFPQIALNIVGKPRDKQYYDKMKELVEKNNLENNINFMGYLDDEELKKEFQKAEIFVLPSYEESQGVVVLEAMAMGKPIVASKWGGISYMVEDKKQGFLVDPQNPKEISEALNSILKNPELKKSMSKNSLIKAKKFSTTQTVKKTIEYYKKIIEED